MLSRVAASCVFLLLVFAAVQAQQGQPPAPEAQPPSQEGPPSSKEEDTDDDDDADDPDDAPPGKADGPLAQAPAGKEDAPPAQEPPPSTQETPPPVQETPPPAQETPRVEGTPPSKEEPPPRAEIRPSERCGAVAYTADGAFGGAFGIDTCEDAERLAIDECRRESTDKADCSRGVVKKTDSWFYVQFCRRGNDWGTHISTGRTIGEVNQAAAQYARTARYGAENCRLVPNGLFHSGGLHTKM